MLGLSKMLQRIRDCPSAGTVVPPEVLNDPCNDGREATLEPWIDSAYFLFMGN